MNYIHIDMTPGNNFTCSSSSSYLSNTCNKAIDGKSTTAWMADNEGIAGWIEIDLPQDYIIHQLTFVQTPTGK